MHDVMSLLVALSEKCRSQHIMIAAAESCTGGLLSSYLTALPGSSAWFDRGFITYSNQAKEEMLEVPSSLILQYGAVSEEVAKAMAIGALKHSQAALTVGITGIAGPDGGSEEKPVGTVCLAFATPTQVQVKQYAFGNMSRENIRQTTCVKALKGLLAAAV